MNDYRPDPESRAGKAQAGEGREVHTEILLKKATADLDILSMSSIFLVHYAGTDMPQ